MDMNIYLYLHISIFAEGVVDGKLHIMNIVETRVAG